MACAVVLLAVGAELTMLEILEKLKSAIKARGGDNGIRTLTRILKRMDTSGDGMVRTSLCACGCEVLLHPLVSSGCALGLGLPSLVCCHGRKW